MKTKIYNKWAFQNGKILSLKHRRTITIKHFSLGPETVCTQLYKANGRNLCCSGGSLVVRGLVWRLMVSMRTKHFTMETQHRVNSELLTFFVRLNNGLNV